MSPPAKVPPGYPSGSRIASKVVLGDVRLSEARLDVGVPPSAGPRDVELDVNLRTAWALSDGGLDVRVGVWVRLVPVGDGEIDDREPVMSIVVEHTVEYSLPNGLEPDDEEVQGFIDQSAVLTAWPYAREAVHGLAARAGVPQLVLPIHKVSLPIPPEVSSRPATKASPKKAAKKKAPAKKKAAAKKAAPRKDVGRRRGSRTGS